MAEAGGRKPLHRQWTFPYRIVRKSLADSLGHCVRYVRGTMLDIGCGEKPYASLFASRVDRHVGLDMHGAPDVAASALDLPIRDESCDTVLCTEVLEHVAEPLQALREIHRVLREGGHALISVPQWWPLHEEPADFYRFTRYGLEHLIMRAGLRVVEMLPRGNSSLCGAQRTCDHLCRHYKWPSDMGRAQRILLELLCAFIQATGYLGARLFPDGSDVLGWTAVATKCSVDAE